MGDAVFFIEGGREFDGFENIDAGIKRKLCPASGGENCVQMRMVKWKKNKSVAQVCNL
jgi:hypothetical protein